DIGPQRINLVAQEIQSGTDFLVPGLVGGEIFLGHLRLIRLFDAESAFVIGPRVFAPFVPNFGLEKCIGVRRGHRGDKLTHCDTPYSLVEILLVGACLTSRRFVFAAPPASSPLRRSYPLVHRRPCVCRARLKYHGRRRRTVRQLCRHVAESSSNLPRSPWSD